MVTRATLNFIYQNLLGRMPEDGAYAHYVGNYTTDFVIDDVSKSVERQTYAQNQAKQANETNSKLASIPVMQEQLDSLTAQVKTLTGQLDDKNKVITNQQKQIDDLKAQLAAQGSDSTQLNALGIALKWLIARLGITK